MKKARPLTLSTSTGRFAERQPHRTLVLHTGSIATALMPGASGVVELVDKYKPAATITFDPNIRSAFDEKPGRHCPASKQLLPARTW